MSAHEQSAEPARRPSLDDLVDDASRDSFPASDPPPWWSDAGRDRLPATGDEPPRP